MKQFTLFSVQLALILSLAGLIACSGSGEKSSSDGGSSTVAVGTSCEGIGAMEGLLACDGNKTLFCSSFTKYKYQLQNTCPEGQICQMTADGKAAKCVGQ